MFDSFADFVQNWGYLAVFLGSMVEGESILLIASASAASGYLSIQKVFWIAFTTTVVVDQILFWIGYRLGIGRILKRFPKIDKKREIVFKYLYKMDILFIFAFRFIYGIRTVSPLIIGAAKIRPWRFIVFNFLSGLCWAASLCFLGFTLADVFKDGKFDSIPAVLAITIIIIIISVGVGLFMKAKERR